MDFRRPHSKDIIQKLVPPLAVWVVTQLLQTRRVSSAVDRADRKIEDGKSRAEKSIRRAGKNAAGNPILLTAGMVAIVTGLGLLTRAATKK